MAKYELLSPVDFGMHYDPDKDMYLEKEEGLSGVHEPGSHVELADDEAQPLLEAGVIKPAGDEEHFLAEERAPEGAFLHHDNPEEKGYAGEKQRKSAQKSQKSAKGTDKKE